MRSFRPTVREHRIDDDPREGMGLVGWLVALWTLAIFAIAWVL